jgi:catechol 2,3-dioxygenase-like lactoylglutathione lyase family enzyme
VQVSSLEAALKFYSEVLGSSCSKPTSWDEDGKPAGEYAFAEVGGLRLELIRDLRAPFVPQPPLPPPYCPHVALETDDLDGAVAVLRENGVPILQGPLTIPECAWVFFADPDGNVLELVQWFGKIDTQREQGRNARRTRSQRKRRPRA